MKHLGVIANCDKRDAVDALGRLERAAKRLDLRLYADPASAALLSPGTATPLEEAWSRLDCLVAMGGDGTMLRAVRQLDSYRDIPVLGVNIGSLGFLTSIAMDDLERALDCLMAGEYSTSSRSMVEAHIYSNNSFVASYPTLNDVVVSNGPTTRVIVLEVAVDGDPVSSCVCDGLIVSTPTGSTGHNLSAGGPILFPETQAFVVSLICPHSLSSRPLVVPAHSRIEVSVTRAAGGAALCMDGQVGHSLLAGDRVLVRQAAKGVKFIHLPDYSYVSVLRQKLQWRGKNY